MKDIKKLSFCVKCPKDWETNPTYLKLLEIYDIRPRAFREEILYFQAGDFRGSYRAGSLYGYDEIDLKDIPQYLGWEEEHADNDWFFLLNTDARLRYFEKYRALLENKMVLKRLSSCNKSPVVMSASAEKVAVTTLGEVLEGNRFRFHDCYKHLKQISFEDFKTKINQINRINNGKTNKQNKVRVSNNESGDIGRCYKRESNCKRKIAISSRLIGNEGKTSVRTSKIINSEISFTARYF